MSVRKTKKAMKNSNGFLSIRLKKSCGIVCINEWNTILFSKNGICFITGYESSYYIPYNTIAEVM